MEGFSHPTGPSRASRSIELVRLLPGHEPAADACTQALGGALLSVEGVIAAELVVSGGARFEVEYDPSRLAADELDDRAAAAGNDVALRYGHADFDLAGLHCADCASKIEAVTLRLPGVLTSTASYGSEKLHVAYDRTDVTPERVLEEVRSLGYGVALAGDGSTPDVSADAPAGARSVRALPPDLLLSFASGAGLLLGFVLQKAGAPAYAWLPAYLGAYVAGGWHATRHAWRAALKRRFDIDLLMVVAALGAASLGAWAEGALLLFLFSLGHALEHLAMNKARNAIRALSDLTPKVARVRRGGTVLEVPVTDLVVGDRVLVRSGERIPADGDVVAGASMVDQAPITGESLPVLKEVGAQAFAGSVNGTGALEIVATKPSEETVLARVVKSVESAQRNKAPSHRFSDRFQLVLTPVILVVTLLVIVVPPLLGVPFSTSFMRAMTLLVAASPCALALATPSAVLSGLARAARGGVLMKGGEHLERAGMAKVVVFDKTGTLTRGLPVVTDVIAAPAATEAELLGAAYAVETASSHPLAGAVTRAAEERLGNALPGAAQQFAEVVGHGATGTVEGRHVLVGNRKLLQDSGAHVPAGLDAAARELAAAGKTVVFVAATPVGGGAAPAVAHALGLLAVRDELRPEAQGTVAKLRRLGVERLVMLTGDAPAVGEAIANELGLDEVRAGLLPEEKAAAIEELRRAYGPVVMVGDGINDAPALATADVGVAMGGAGSDVALETADVALMADDLTGLPFALDLSRASRRMIVQNLAISLGVIALLVPSSLLGLATIGVAIVLHESSTLVVVLNALRLLSFRSRLPGSKVHRAAAA